VLAMLLRIVEPTARSESQGCGNAGQSSYRKRSAQSAKKAGLAGPDRQLRNEIGDHGDPSSDGLHPAAKPADRSRQCYLWPANQIGGGFHTPGRLRHRDASLDRIKQARQPGSKKVWEKAECPVSLGTVPSGNAQPRRRHARIATVTGK